MLVLSRNVGESIVVDGPCVLTVTEVRGGKVRIGCVAERDVRIDRAEVAERRDLPQEDAA